MMGKRRWIRQRVAGGSHIEGEGSDKEHVHKKHKIKNERHDENKEKDK